MPNINDWNAEGQWRSDGLTVTNAGDHWIILPGDDRNAVDSCPCCGALMRTRRQAKLVADKYYPLPDDPHFLAAFADFQRRLREP